jgi:hypothetical protein
LNKDFLAPCPGDCTYPFGHSPGELLARKKNLWLEFELVWRQNRVSYGKIGAKRVQIRARDFSFGPEARGCDQSDTIPWTWRKEILVQTQFGR